MRVAVALTLAYRRGGVASDGLRKKRDGGASVGAVHAVAVGVAVGIAVGVAVGGGRRSVDDGFFITVVFSTG